MAATESTPHPTKEDVMSKGRDRPGKEKKKPKADKNKKDKHAPFGGKTPMTTAGAAPKK
jgi:hypothetical protein